MYIIRYYTRRKDGTVKAHFGKVRTKQQLEEALKRPSAQPGFVSSITGHELVKLEYFELNFLGGRGFV